VPPVNFYRAIQGQQPPAIARAVALTWMGVRLEQWPEDDRSDLEIFFSRIAFKETAEWKEEIVQLNPEPTGPMEARLPDGSKVMISADQDPRELFADWLIDANNPWFARNMVNRIWFWLLGRGLIHEPDDIRSDNRPVHPRLLAYLEKELIRNHYDSREIYRRILNSNIYQQSSIPGSEHPDAESLFACYPVRPLDAEVLCDAIDSIYGGGESYTSNIPEPFSFIPAGQRAIALADGSITSGFLEMFGRPSRDTGLLSERKNEPTEAQRLHLLNSTHIQRKIERSEKLRSLVRRAKKDRRLLVQSLYLRILSRQATQDELTTAKTYLQTSGVNLSQGAVDLAWALTNSKEFLYRH